MFLHIGRGHLLRKDDIIGIFDLEITTQSKRTKAYLAKKEKEKRVVNVCDDIPRSFIVATESGDEEVFISQISPQTLKARSEELIQD